jgi:saccharopine dehydrogenase-like NADP-dependent oxidoreductase
MSYKVAMKKVFILGVGAQGSTVAQRLDEEPGVEEIICADYDEKAVDGIVKVLKKGRGLKVDGTKPEEIISAAKGADLLVNALPLNFAKQSLDAALEVRANYQDFACGTNVLQTDDEYTNWLDGVDFMYKEYGKRFAEIGKTAVVGTGSSPGLMCVVARRAMRELDTCDTIYNMVYEAVEAKRFLPFWWSPDVALQDMMFPAVAFENGKYIKTESFSKPIRRKFPELGDMEVELYEHNHDEPIYMGANADTLFKGAKNIYFKYGGVGINFAKPLYRAGLLSKDEMLIKGRKSVPFDVVLACIPPAPKYREEIKEIIDEGLVTDTGAFVVEAYGKKDGKNVMVDIHVASPGLADSFARSKLTAEMYQTGQCGFLFTKMFVEDKYTQPGLITSDMLTEEQLDYYLDEAAKLDITLNIDVKEI